MGRYGSAVTIMGVGSTLTVNGGKFSGGVGTVGSAIYAKNATSNITDALFANNGTGGSVLWFYAGEATLTDVVFQSNTGTKIKTEKNAVVNEVTTPDESAAILDEAFAELFADDLEVL